MTMRLAGPFEAILLASLAELQGTNLPTDQKTTIPEAVEVYSRALDDFRSTASPAGGVEKLLQLGRRAARALLRSDDPGSPNVLERLRAEDFHKVVLRMEGFLVNREETVYVEPEPNFFLAFA